MIGLTPSQLTYDSEASLKGGWSELESGVQKMHIGIVNYR